MTYIIEFIITELTTGKRSGTLGHWDMNEYVASMVNPITTLGFIYFSLSVIHGTMLIPQPFVRPFRPPSRFVTLAWGPPAVAEHFLGKFGGVKTCLSVTVTPIS